MLEVLYKKGMVLAIICLFIGAGVVPSISGNLENINYENKEIYNNNINIDEYIDLIVTDIWENNNTIYFQIQNIGTMYSEYECYAALYIDDNFTTDFLINIYLGPQERDESYFDYFWYCSSLHDTIRVIIDYTDVVEEIDELNNEREEVWKCDNDPPTIVSGPLVINIAQDSVELFWETDDLSDSRVIFGKTAKEFPSEVIDDEYVTNHAIIIDDLEPSSVYHYVVESTDASNNRVVSSDMIFETSDEIDPEKPTIDLVVPGEINETVFLTAFAEDNIDIEKVEFYLSDTLLHTDFSKPYNYIFNSKEFSNGDYIVKGKAFDLVGNSNEEEEVVVGNTIDNNPPFVDLFKPAGSQVEGFVECWVSLYDDSGLRCIDCYVDDTLVHSKEFKNHIESYTWHFWFNSLGFEDGKHSLTVIAYDVTRKESSDSKTIFIKNEKPIDPVFFYKKT